MEEESKSLPRTETEVESPAFGLYQRLQATLKERGGPQLLLPTEKLGEQTYRTDSRFFLLAEGLYLILVGWDEKCSIVTPYAVVQRDEHVAIFNLTPMIISQQTRADLKRVDRAPVLLVGKEPAELKGSSYERYGPAHQMEINLTLRAVEEGKTVKVIEVSNPGQPFAIVKNEIGASTSGRDYLLLRYQKQGPFPKVVRAAQKAEQLLISWQNEGESVGLEPNNLPPSPDSSLLQSRLIDIPVLPPNKIIIK